MILGVTGHRPEELPGGYDPSSPERIDLIKRIKAMVFSRNPALVLSGMALGVDQYVCEICLSLGIPYVAVVPFVGQESRWPPAAQAEYKELLKTAIEVVVTDDTPGYEPWKMELRNHYIVDRCDELLAVFNGSPGGTANTVLYAQSIGKPLIIMPPENVENKDETTKTAP